MRLPPALVAMMCVTSAAVAEGPRFTVIPVTVRAMNADGNIVAGNGPHPGHSSVGLVYDLASGGTSIIVGNPVYPQNTGITAMSSDGQYFAGGAPSGVPVNIEAYRLAASGDHSNIGRYSGSSHSGAYAISGDGNVLAGVSDLHGNGVTRFPFRWTPQAGRQEIGPANGLLGGDVRDISRDGTTIVGSGGPLGGNGSLGWVWREGSGFSFLPSLAGFVGTSANAVSADGSIIVGVSPLGEIPPNNQVVRWVNGLIEVINLGPGLSNPGIEDVSDDGNVIVGGVALQGVGSRGMICTPELGVMLASDYLALHGLTLPEGVGIRRIYAVSADGMTFGGSLSSGGGFVATVPAPGVTGLLAAAGLFASRRRRV